MKLNTAWIAASLISAFVVGPVFADSHANKRIAEGVKARQAQMKINNFNLKILGAMAKGDAEYDAEAATVAASNIVHSASIHQPQAWLPGSDNSAIEGTRALPALWENFPDAAEKSAELLSAAEAMKAVAGNGQVAVNGAFDRLVGACIACHKSYRAAGN